MAKDNNFSYEITDEIAVISTSGNGWQLELNKVAWGDRDPKYDLRRWSSDHERCGKGLTLSPKEVRLIAKTLARVAEDMDEDE